MRIPARALPPLLGATLCAALFLHCGSFSEGTVDASVDAAPETSATLDGAVVLPPDAAIEADAGCHPPAAPVNLCFVKAGPQCVVKSVTFDTIADPNPVPSPISLAYPHHPVRWGNYLFVAVHEKTDPGRNIQGAGYIVRVDVPTMANPTIASRRLEQPGALVASDGYLYFRTVSAGPVSKIERIDLTAPNPCAASACESETVTTVTGARIEQIFVRSPTDVYFRFGDSSLQRTTRSGGMWDSPAPVLSGTGPGTLAGNRWAVPSGDGNTLLHDLSPASPVPIARWKDKGSRWITSACEDTFFFESEADKPFYRVVPEGDGDGGSLGTIAPLECKGCAKRLIFSASVDEQFVYVAAPNAGGHVRAVPRAGGDSVTLVTDDVWDVINDDDAVYFTVMSATPYLGRIAKR